MRHWILSLALLLPIYGWASHRPNDVSYAMNVELDPETAEIKGHESLRVTNHSQEIFTLLYLHVYPNAFRRKKTGTYMQEIRDFENPDLHFIGSGKGGKLEVSTIKQSGHDAKFEIERELMTVTLPTPLKPGETTVLEIDFLSRVGAVAERSGTWDGNFAVSQWFPKLMVHDEKGWALEHNRDYHFVGEFYGDFGSYDVRITVPRGMKVGATGHLADEHEIDGGKKTLHFMADRVHDFAWAADERYSERFAQVGRTKIHVLTRHEESADAVIEYAKRAFEYFSKRIGPYPYDDFTVATTYYNGTMEYPQINFVRSWPAGLARWVERSFLGELLELYVAHETAHQWFYGVVGNNEVVDAWLDEGFVTFLEESYIQDVYGKDENFFRIEPFKTLFKLDDTQLGDLIWRLAGPDVTQPVQTPSYKFRDPNHYYASVYYQVAVFFRHFQALVGREKSEAILREYYRRNSFRNAKPDDWYRIVEEMAGPQMAKTWKTWINERTTCDYTVGATSSKLEGDGLYHQHFRVEQRENYFVPVDVEVTDSAGVSKRVRAPISKEQKQVELDVTMSAPLKSVVVDPDRVTPDVDRFNNDSDIFPKIKFWPWTTNTIHDDALLVVPLPYYVKRPGIGNETGALIGALHYADWYGIGMFGYDWLHKSMTVNFASEALQPNYPIDWEAAYQRDVITHRGNLFLKKAFGAVPGRDPRFTIEGGSEYFGSLGDSQQGLGGGAEIGYTNIDNGHEIRYAVAAHGSAYQNLSVDHRGLGTRVFGTGRLIVPIPLLFRSQIDVRGIVGDSNGNAPRSALYNLVSPDDGNMRFDYDYGTFRLRAIRAANAELKFPIPYKPFIDKIGFIHGPTWEWHLFGDFSNSPDKTGTIMDFGIGTRFQLATGGYGGIVLNLELVPYQNATNPKGWGAPVVFATVQGKVF